MNFIMLIGCSGSGKSTLVEEIRQTNPNITVISSDAVIEDFAAAEGLSYQEAYPKFADQARDICEQTAVRAFERGLDVVWDQTNLYRDIRTDRLAMVPDGYTKIGVVLEGSRAALRARIEARAAAGGREIPLEVTDKQIAGFIPPDFDEGFDRILSQHVPEPAADAGLVPA